MLYTAFALAVARTHDGHATVLEHSLDVIEVEVDETVVGDDLCDRLGSHAERVVSLLEGAEHGEVRINLAEAFVVDDEQSVHVLRHLLHAVERLVYLALALEAERYGDDTYGEDAHLLRYSCDDRCGTRSGSATHSCRDESHLGAVVEHFLDGVDAVLGSLTCLGGLVASTESLFAELQQYGHAGVAECLVVGVAENERDVVNALLVHVVDSVAATATYANGLYDGVLFFWCSEVHHCVCIVVWHGNVSVMLCSVYVSLVVVVLRLDERLAEVGERVFHSLEE